MNIAENVIFYILAKYWNSQIVEYWVSGIREQKIPDQMIDQTI